MEEKKVKLDLGTLEFTHRVAEREGIEIKNRISHEMKEQFAMEQVEGTLGSDDSLGVCYLLATYDLIENYLFAKYYTNIDVSEINTIDDYRRLYDYMLMNRLVLKDEYVWEYVGEDYALIRPIEEVYRDSVVKLYEAEHSLGNLVKGLLNTDPDTNNEETRKLIEAQTDMKGALLEKQEQEKMIEFGKKKPTSLKTGGVKVSLAKR